MSTSEAHLHRQKAVEVVAAACRAIKRPDAAQALEDRTEEEWALCEKLANDGWLSLDFGAERLLDRLFIWDLSPEGQDYWWDVLKKIVDYTWPEDGSGPR
jgi:hypothetical protein